MAPVEGALIKGPSSGSIYVLELGKKRLITSATVYENCRYSWYHYVVVPDWVVNMIPNGTNVNGPVCPFTLPQRSDSAVFVIDNALKRWITSLTSFNYCGYDSGAIYWPPDSAINAYPTGANLASPPCPFTRSPWYHLAAMEGTLVKGVSSGSVYVIDAAKKRLITTGAVFDYCGYKWNDIVTISDSAISAIPTGVNVTGRPCPYTLMEGNFSTVYVVGKGMKRSLTSASVFDACGYVWSEIIYDPIVETLPAGAAYTSPPCAYVRQ